MGIRWNGQAHRDLIRVHAFLAPVNPAAAASVAEGVIEAIEHLGARPRLGSRLPEFDPREVRHLIAGDYEIRYEVSHLQLIILRIWHVREDR